MCSDSAEKDIRRLYALFDENIISKDEFESGKANALSRVADVKRSVKRKLPTTDSDSESDPDLPDLERDPDWESDPEVTDASDYSPSDMEGHNTRHAEKDPLVEETREEPKSKFPKTICLYETRKACRDHVKQDIIKWSWTRSVGAYGHKGETGAAFVCRSHANCSARIRYRGPRKGEDKWVLESNDIEHSTQDHDQDSRGIYHEFKEKIATHIEAGDVPQRILNKLHLKYRGQQSMLAKLPTVSQIRDFKRNIVRRATGSIKIESVADLVELTKGMELNPNSLAGDDNALFVLPDGVFQCGDGDGFGFVFSTRNIIRNAERARDAWGGKFPGECDGSWKFVYCGWPILAFGTHHLYYDKKDGEIRQQFRPISFMFTKGESHQAFERLFKCTLRAVELLYSFTIELCTVCSDKADGIRSAFLVVWPTAIWVTCWPHISMKPRKEWVKHMVSKDKSSVVKACDQFLHLLHLARTRQQFKHLARLMIHQVRNKHKEEDLANLVEKEYTSPPYDCWFVTASGVVMCDPSSQPIEAYWKQVKTTKLNHLRARLDNMLHEQLPNWLYLDAVNGLCDPISAGACGVVPAEIVFEAFDKLQAKDYKRVSGVYYVNTKTATGTEVTTDRVREFEQSLVGEAQVRVQLSIDSFVEKYMSLHKVQWQDSRWVCDCKGYWHGGVCSHSHLVLHLEKKVDLKELCSTLPKREKSGRKRRTKGAWHKQGPSPTKKSKQSKRAKKTSK